MKLNKIKELLKKVSVSCMIGCYMFSANVYAASQVTKPLENLKTLLISAISVIGVIIFAKNVMEAAQAYQQQDSSSLNSAIKGILAGAIMAAISAVISFLGVS